MNDQTAKSQTLMQYGVTHCPHCELPYAPDGCEPEDERYCHGEADLLACSTVQLAAEDDHLIAVLQERDALRAELARVHDGQLSMLVALAAAGAPATGGALVTGGDA